MRLDEFRQLDRVGVFKSGVLAGSIERTLSGSIFRYDTNYLHSASSSGHDPIAFAIPFTSQEVKSSGDSVHPFFAGLLPEGRRLQGLVRATKTSPDDLFTLLAASGRNCIGDVWVEDQRSSSSYKISELPETLSEASFFEVFEQSIAATDYRFRLRDPSVPGVHPKISSELISLPISVKSRRKQYVLKLGTKDFPRLVENENFFMKVASDAGIPTATTSVVIDRDGVSGLLVERFDRQVESGSSPVPLHQEDACQFLGRYPQDKYRISLREIGEGIRKHADAPILEIGRLIELTAFSYLIGNGDLHGKNVSLIKHPKTKRVTLSPAYDILSTIPYGDDRMALQMEGRDDNLSRRDFINFGKHFEVPEAAVVRSLNRICRVVSKAENELSLIGFDKKKCEALSRVINKRVGDLS